MITLYDYGNSVCCQKVRITLCEKGLDWNAVGVDLFANEQYDPKYLTLNPRGVVPTLVHDGVPVIESTLICEYLDETFPGPALIPEEPARRALMRLWSKLVDEGLFEGASEISFSAMFRDRMQKMAPDAREQRLQNIGDPRRRDRYRSTYELGVQSPFVLHAVYAYERAFTFMEEALAGGAPWLLGQEVTLADINLMPFVARLSYLGLLDTWISHRPRVTEWWERTREWPSFRRGLSDRVTEIELDYMRTHGLKIRPDIQALTAKLRITGAGDV